MLQKHPQESHMSLRTTEGCVWAVMRHEGDSWCQSPCLAMSPWCTGKAALRLFELHHHPVAEPGLLPTHQRYQSSLKLRLNLAQEIQ